MRCTPTVATFVITAALVACGKPSKKGDADSSNQGPVDPTIADGEFEQVDLGAIGPEDRSQLINLNAFVALTGQLGLEKFENATMAVEYDSETGKPESRVTRTFDADRNVLSEKWEDADLSTGEYYRVSETSNEWKDGKQVKSVYLRFEGDKEIRRKETTWEYQNDSDWTSKEIDGSVTKTEAYVCQDLVCSLTSATNGLTTGKSVQTYSEAGYVVKDEAIDATGNVYLSETYDFAQGLRVETAWNDAFPNGYEHRRSLEFRNARGVTLESSYLNEDGTYKTHETCAMANRKAQCEEETSNPKSPGAVFKRKGTYALVQAHYTEGGEASSHRYQALLSTTEEHVSDSELVTTTTVKVAMNERFQVIGRTEECVLAPGHDSILCSDKIEETRQVDEKGRPTSLIQTMGGRLRFKFEAQY